jgi:hypothetical protein
MAIGEITMTGADPAWAVSAIVALPPLLFTTRFAVNVPAAVGENVTVAVVEAPAASVAPLPGRPVTE